MERDAASVLAGHHVTDTAAGDGTLLACSCSCGWRSEPVGRGDREAARTLAEARVRHWMDVAGEAAGEDPALNARVERLAAEHQRGEDKTLTKVAVTCTCGWRSPPLQRGHPRLAQAKADFWQRHVLDFTGFNASVAPPGGLPPMG